MYLTSKIYNNKINKLVGILKNTLDINEERINKLRVKRKIYILRELRQNVEKKRKRKGNKRI